MSTFTNQMAKAPTHVCGLDPLSGLVIIAWSFAGHAIAKALAVHYHGHPLSQAVLLVL